MTQVKMPEPVAYLACNPETNKPEWSESCVCEDPVFTLDDTGTISRGVVFVDQAEAYADARVREALEAAAKICDDRAIKNEAAVSADEPDEASSLRADAWQMGVCARDIRALIPLTKNESEE